MNKEEQSITRRDGRGVVHAVVGMIDEDVDRLLARPDALLWRFLDRPLKIDHASLIVRAELAVDGRGTPLVYKRYRPRNAWKALLGFLRPSRAVAAWRRGHALLARGIATPRPLAVVLPRRPRFPRESYLATQWIEGAKNLHLFAWELADRPLDERLAIASVCAERLGELLGRMHANRISHRDLKGSNILFSHREGTDADHRIHVHLIDLDAARLRRRLSARRREADLARLAVSLAAHPWLTHGIRRRFLRAYEAEFRVGTGQTVDSSCRPIEWKRLWRAIRRRAQRRIARKRRRGQDVL